MAKIFLGDSKNYGNENNDSLKKAPFKPDGTEYDSVTGITSTSPVYIIYHNLQAYPYYLITYKYFY